MRRNIEDRDVIGRAFKRSGVDGTGEGQEESVESTTSIAEQPTSQYAHQYHNIDISGEARVHIGDAICHYYIAPQPHVSHRRLTRPVVTLVTCTRSVYQLSGGAGKAASANGIMVVGELLFPKLEKPRVLFLVASWKRCVTTCIRVRRGEADILSLAGCGKTILSATALQNIFCEATLQPDVLVGYFYFDFNSAEKQHSQSAIRSLLFQFALQSPDCLQALEHSYQRYDNGHQQPSEDSIRSMLHSVLALENRKYIVLDALDECTDREDLLPFVRNLAILQQYKVCLLATSRRERDIEEELMPVTTQVLNIQNAEVGNDIRLYVYDQLATDLKLKKWPPYVKDEIAGELINKANGMFRWVYCQLGSLRKCVKLSALRKTLSSLPKTLDETYTRIIQTIELNDQLSDAIKVLRWLCFSERPLRLSEVVEVLAIENRKGFDPDERLPDPEDIIAICSSLITYGAKERGGEGEQEDDDDDFDNEIDKAKQGCARQGDDIEVRLAHFSVKEYLLSDRCSLQSVFEIQICHQAVAVSCLHYLLYISDQTIPTAMIKEEYPLVQYAAQYWWQHAQSIGNKFDLEILGLTRSLLMNKTKLLTWLRRYNVDKRWKRRDPSLTTEDLALPLYYAAQLGLLDVVGSLIKEDADVNAQGGEYGNALQAASVRGHEKVVQMLLDKGADVNAKGGLYGNALQAALEDGHERVVQMLLDKGADVNAQGGWRHGNALQAASVRGHEKVVQMLLDKGANVNAQGGGHYGNALQAASARGHEKVVQMLLHEGADADAQGGGDYGNALQAALVRGHEKVVQMLLDKGANANAQGGGHYGNALQAASVQGHEKVVQMLLDKGVDINAQGGDYGNALQAASVLGHEKVVQILLNNGANVIARGGLYGNALQAASVRGHAKVVQMLLDKGADVNAQGGEYGNALQAASVRGHEKVVQMLLGKGADFNAQGGRRHGNALQAASARGHERVVRILLDKGADVNVQGRGHYGNALQAASVQGYEKVVQMLLDEGANVNAQGGGYYGTALQAASFGGHKRVVQILLDKGADVNVQGKWLYKDALQAASLRGHEEVKQMLLSAGMSPSIRQHI